ncbi:MAG: cytochrome bd ubiquinol oxidase subunit [Solirubrobacterales bacterium]|nr:cytochrome bd ubiquinol oxidase subunit [Solirubrobacterales bacterium]
MSKPDAAAATLWIGATLYAVFGGADFGAGFWQLPGLRGKEQESVRLRIEHSVAPVWEANHVWLIFMLVILWTGFPDAFSAIFSTLYIPLALAALGIVLRGAAFAFGKVVEGEARRRAGVLFAVSSVLTPFFMGTVAGAIASGEVPAAGNGDPTGSWIGPLPLLIGTLFVASGAYLAAVFLVRDSWVAGEIDNTRHFSRCALGAALLAGALAAAGILVLRHDARFVYDGLTGPGLPLVIASLLCGLIALGLLVRGQRRGFTPRISLLVRPAAVGAVVTVIWGSFVAQHPYLLPTSLTISDAAAPGGTLTALLVVFGAAVVFVLPSLALLYTLSQKDVLK